MCYCHFNNIYSGERIVNLVTFNNFYQNIIYQDCKEYIKFYYISASKESRRTVSEGLITGGTKQVYNSYKNLCTILFTIIKTKINNSENVY